MDDAGVAQLWDAAYADVSEPGRPSELVTAHFELLADCGTALDLAGGTGGTALWLAERGISTTLVDISGRALEIANRAAAVRHIRLHTVRADLETDPPPVRSELAGGVPSTRSGDGWHALVCSNFFHPPLLAALASYLVPGGIAFVVVATVDNLQRNPRPGRRYLVERGELSGLCEGLEPISFAEDWFGGRHEARLVARRPGATGSAEQPVRWRRGGVGEQA